MRRLPTLAAAAGLLAIGLLGLVPSPCVACSCAQPRSLAEATARDPSAAVFAGRVLQADGRSGTMRVDAWFFGPAPAPMVGLRGGDGGDCGLPLVPGQRLILVATREPDGSWFAGLCQPSADLDTPPGRAMADEARTTFGPGTAPPVDAAPGTPVDLPGIAVVAGIIAVAAVLLVVGATLAARSGRRR